MDLQGVGSIEAIERAMKKNADTREGTVTSTREELEDLRARAFRAKDAAARIGRYEDELLAISAVTLAISGACRGTSKGCHSMLALGHQ